MTHLYFDFAQARQNMVENQLRPAEVNHVKLIETMRVLPREECVQDSQREVAYADITLPLSAGRFLSEPRVIARMIQLADIQEDEKVLVVGAGTGYSAAILSYLKAEIHAVEENESLARQGQAFCKRYAMNVVDWHIGKLRDGFPQAAPFNVILIDGAVTDIPEQLVSQLADQGRIVTILQAHDQASHAVCVQKTEQGMVANTSFYAALPILPELLK